MPRIFGAGQAITTPKGHGAGAAWAEAEGEEEFYRAAIEELEAGADHVKVAINGGLAREGEDISGSEMTDEELNGTVRAAREHGTYVVAHSGASTAIRQALARGVRCFEHAYELDPGTASLLAGQGAYITPTLVVTRCEQWMRANGFAEASIATARRVADGHLESIRHAIAAGVPLLCGTDLPPADDVGGLPATVVEMTLLEGAGLSRLGALQTATTNPARLMGVEGEIGQARPGFRADLVVVDDNPLDDLAALGSVDVYKRQGQRLMPEPVVIGQGALLGGEHGQHGGQRIDAEMPAGGDRQMARVGQLEVVAHDQAAHRAALYRLHRDTKVPKLHSRLLRRARLLRPWRPGPQSGYDVTPEKPDGPQRVGPERRPERQMGGPVV